MRAGPNRTRRAVVYASPLPSCDSTESPLAESAGRGPFRLWRRQARLRIAWRVAAHVHALEPWAVLFQRLWATTGSRSPIRV